MKTLAQYHGYYQSLQMMASIIFMHQDFQRRTPVPRRKKCRSNIFSKYTKSTYRFDIIYLRILAGEI